MGRFSLSSGKPQKGASVIEHRVKCTICGAILTCSSENTAPLVNHLQNNHPDVQVARFPELKPSLENNEQVSKESKSFMNECIKNGSERKDTTGNETLADANDDLATGDHEKDNKVEKKKIIKLYETTVEVWQSSKGPVLCHNCGECQTPFLRARKKSISESSAAAMCLLGCWPLCFLPFMMNGGNSGQLTDSYCSKCGHILKNKDSKG